MKKIIITAIAFAMLVACGGNEKKVPTVKDKAIQLMEKMVTTMEEGKLNQLSDIEEEMEDWYESLSEEEQEKVMEATAAWEEKNERRIEKAYDKLIEVKVNELSEELLTAMEKGDWDAIENIEAEMEDWYESLSEEEQEKVMEASAAWEEKNENRIKQAYENLE